jgi:glycosyltransferase involved in cell wall biosynthesis
MNIVQITPGAGAMYCGNCLRDNALVAALRKLGHSVLMVPLYLPLTLDETDESRGIPVFFNGVNVWLDQKSAWFRGAPAWVHRLTGSRAILGWAARRVARTRASDVGDITLSMIRGEHGNQARELDDLIAFLKTQPRPDVICLSNALLLGMARRLKSELRAPIACALQGEDTFLDALPEKYRDAAWRELTERARDVDLFIAPTRYFADLMQRRLSLPPGHVRVIYNGINLDGYAESPAPAAPTIGYFARMCREKGLDVLVEAFLILKDKRVPQLKLRIGGSCGPADEPFVSSLRKRLAPFEADVAFHPNVDRAAKLAFLHSLSVFSVPALYGEAFGLYVLEALASGVPVVQPHHAAFPELIEMSGGGITCRPGDPAALADSIESLLLNDAQLRALGAAGAKSVRERFTAERMARQTLLAFEELASRQLAPGQQTAAIAR